VGRRTSNEIIIGDLKAKVGLLAKLNAARAGISMRDSQDRQTVNPRERNTMLRLFFAMAVKRYKYDPKAQ
jgi:hypothetical protein